MRELQDQDVQFKLLTRLLPLLDQLHDMGVERDTAGNRRLFYDDYVKFVVLYLTTPIIESISGLQRAAQLPPIYNLETRATSGATVARPQL